ncbi:amino acid/amide ABC transporter membrane protein 2 (HAAT family) /amino acid/amide ABC transporter ATP-binding protein 1 (HAAT family) [Blastococcus colisei]|uniref:Amino acid/amide ABC transporter membrane protein 2 (HAAT family) /amino acid/amide ABC transporter ATP-binding protein 1 (HAAT family) n=1 Tax=Blastococcus colisei TaxID=1564162 RepID=A0A543PG58_9ACTN|nr:branched-chain amino acid ABC transporter ATP-binding protein/permease [Blastococcus colisei]TQN43055.1 amino acid/amide ABC transporter membrane protein 2 (HAAT family) /amino acid/amide ABC transporter ATP-binding protein 1 (HAAT family) [Blastococcus colisei]
MNSLRDGVRRITGALPPWAFAAAAVVVVLVIPFTSPPRLVQLTIIFGINALLAQSINVLTGYAGQISLGQAAIYGTGAYGTAVMSVQYDWPLWASVPAGIVMAIIVGALVSIPAGRVHEFYLAMVTLGLGILAFTIFRQWGEVTGGFSGLGNIPSPPLGSLTVFGYTLGLVSYFYVTVVLVVVVTWLLANILKSHVGRSFVALQESELAASTLGVNPARRKRLAYVLSAALAGIAGVTYAHVVGFVSPDAFSVNASIAILVFAVLGGMRTLAGPFLGAALLTYLPDQLQAFSEWQHLIYGLILLFSFIVLPRGLAGLFPYRTSLIHHRVDRRRDEKAEPAEVQPAEQSRDGAAAAGVAEGDVLLEVRDVVMNFSGVRALDGVSISVRKGSIHGLIGPNGSGKTTLLNVVSGVYKPTSGQVSFGGVRADGRKPHQVATLGIGRTFQHPLVFDELTVRENVVVGAERLFRSRLVQLLFGTRAAVREERRMVRSAEAAIERVGLEELREALAGGLPFGRQRLLELARSLAGEPLLLMLDEPAAGLAEDDLVELASLLQTLRDGGMTVLLIEHHMDFLLRLVETVTVLDQGEVIFDGTPAAARSDERVLEAYLGASAAATGV